MSNFRAYNKVLCPELWDNYQHLDPRVRVNLLRMAYDFYEKPKFPAKIIDVYLMGSIANYNWSPDSDIDVHVIIDYNQLKMLPETANKVVKIASAQWNLEHEISVKGHKVELNIQNFTEKKPHVTGIYSLVKDVWIRKPFLETPQIDKQTVQVQFMGMKKYLGDVIASKNRETMKEAKTYIDAYRQYGLDNHGELSIENIVFKILRSRGIIKSLKDAINITYDQEMSVKEAVKDTPRLSIKPPDHRGVIGIYLGNIKFAQMYKPGPGWGDWSGKWVLNRERPSIDMGFPNLDKGYNTPDELLADMNRILPTLKNAKKEHIDAPVEESWHDSNSDIIVGTFDVDDIIRAKKGGTHDKNFNFRGFSDWRYNEFTGLIYWKGDWSEHSKHQERMVREYLENEGYKVKGQVPLEGDFNDSDDAGDEFAQRWNDAHGVYSENIVEDRISKFNSQLQKIKQHGSSLNKKMRLIENGYRPQIVIDSEDNYILSGHIDLMAAHKLNNKNISVKYITKPFLFENKIKEIFNPNLPIELKQSGDNYSSNFEYNKEQYEVNIDLLNNLKNAYDVRFKKLSNIDKITDLKSAMNQIQSIYGNSNLNDELKIYSYVISTVNKFIKEHSPAILFFYTNNPQKHRIYDKIIRKYLPSNYKCKTEEYVGQQEKQYVIGVIDKNVKFKDSESVQEGYGAGIPEEDRLKITNDDGEVRRWQIKSKDAPKTPKMTDEVVLAVTDYDEPQKGNCLTEGLIEESKFRGEWWFGDGTAMFADGDVGDINHEGMVIDRLKREIIDALGGDASNDEHAGDFDDYADEIFEHIGDEFTPEELEDWNDRSYFNAIKSYITRTGSVELKEKFLYAYSSNKDARDYALKYWNWQRVKGNVIQTHTLSARDIHNIINGLWDAYGEELDDPEAVFYIEVMATRSFYEDIPWQVLKKGDPTSLNAYRTRY